MKKDFSKYKDTLTIEEVQEILGVDSQSVLRLCEEKEYIERYTRDRTFIPKEPCLVI